MTIYKRQFVQESYRGFAPIDITVIKHAGSFVLLRQEDNMVRIDASLFKEFADEINEVKKWLTSS